MRQQRRIFACGVIFGIILITFWPASLRAQSIEKTSERLVREADVIAVGKVTTVKSEWNETRSMIRTRVTVTIDQTLKGGNTAKTITILVPGGEVDGVGEWYSHTARFVEDEDVVLFAQKNERGGFRVAGGEEGKIAVTRDEVTGARVIPNFGQLDRFTNQIQAVVKKQETETLQK